MKILKSKIKYILPMFLISLIFITIGSKNSPLYLLNDWHDAQAFMTMGKGLINGLIPYKDLFEQKGPILYFIYAIANLISTKSFIGVYIIEVLFFTVFLTIVRKTINLFYEDKYSIPSIMLLTLGIMLLKPFGHGGSAEELCLPFFAYSIYSMLKYLKTGNITKKEILINGIMAGIILWTKYTLLGFHFILAATFFFVNVSKHKYIDAIKSSFIYLSGMFIVTIPILLFFLLNNAIKELFNVYFIINMTSYSKITSTFKKITTAFGLLGFNLVSNIPFIIFIVIPLIYYIFKRVDFKIKGSKIIILISLLVMGLGTFIGGTNYFYYSFIITPFMILGVLMINSLLSKYNVRINNIRTFSLLLLLVTILIEFSPNIEYTHRKHDDYAQLVFGDIIKESKDKTLINYGFLDGGFYFTSDSLPECYYFMKNNFSYENFPEMYEEQKRYVLQNRPHFVVTRTNFLFLNENNYKLVKSMRQKYEDEYHVYYLYERIAQ